MQQIDLITILHKYFKLAIGYYTIKKNLFILNAYFFIK